MIPLDIIPCLLRVPNTMCPLVLIEFYSFQAGLLQKFLVSVWEGQEAHWPVLVLAMMVSQLIQLSFEKGRRMEPQPLADLMKFTR